MSKNRIERYYPGSDFVTPRHPDVIPNLYAGNGTHVDVKIARMTGFMTISWLDTDDMSHKVTYSNLLGNILAWKSTPFKESA